MKNIIFYCFVLLLSIRVSGMEKPDNKDDSSYIFIASIIEGQAQQVYGDIFLYGPIFFRIRTDYQFSSNYSNPLQFFNENGYGKFIYNLKEEINQKKCPKYMAPYFFDYYKQLHYCISIYRIKKESLKIEDFNSENIWYNKRHENDPILFEKIKIDDCSSLEVVSFFHFNLGYDNFSWDEFDKYECIKSFFGR